MSKFTDLLANPRAIRRYLVEVTAYNRNTPGVETLYFCGSALGFVTAPSDNPSNKVFDPSLQQPLVYSQTLFQSGAIGGSSVPASGSMTFLNHDGHLDYLKDYSFDARQVIVRLGGENFTYPDFGVVFNGTAQGIEFGSGFVTLRVRDLQYKLQSVLQSNAYSGAGGWNGTSDLAGVPLPTCIGQVRNAEPRLVDSVNLRYQIHWRAVQAISSVKDQGSALTNFGDYGNTTLLDAAVIPAGNYATCLAAGVFKLGSTPSGTITFDAQGDNVGGYVSSTADCVQRLVTSLGGFLTSDLVASTFTAHNALSLGATTLASVVVGYYDRGNSGVTIAQALDRLTNATGSWYAFDRLGLLRVGRVDLPSGTPVISFSSQDLLSFFRVPVELPTWRLKLGYRPTWRPMTQQEIAGIFRPGGASAASGPLLTDAYRYVTASDASTKTASPLAQDRSLDTVLDSATDAAAEAARRLNVLKTPRDVYRFTVKTQSLALNLGDLILVTHSRYNLGAGKQFIILGVTENYLTSESTLEVWG